MLGLFGSLSVASRSMQVQQQGIEVAGHNMANVNNPAYSRQRLAIQAASPVATPNGLVGAGSESSRILQVRNLLLDARITTESSVSGSLESQRQALQYAQANLGQQIDRQASGPEGAAAAAGIGSQHGIGESLSAFFDSLQKVSVQTSDPADRGLVLTRAQQLAERFRQTDSRLAELNQSLNQVVDESVAQVNNMLEDIARLNAQIGEAEVHGDGAANDIRDSRQSKLEELAKLVKFDAVSGPLGAVNIMIGGVIMVDSVVVRDRLEGYSDPAGHTLVRASAGNTPLNITGGRLHGAIESRDGPVQKLRDDLSLVAATLISEVNRIHQSGYGLDGSTGLDLFSGSGASDIRLNSAIDPTRLHTSANGEPGNNGTALALAQLSRQPQSALAGQTFGQSYTHIVANLGEALSGVNEQVTDQSVVTTMLSQQRASVSAVSLDEEMTDLLKYQRAYQASAQLVNTINNMLETVIGMVR